MRDWILGVEIDDVVSRYRYLPPQSFPSGWRWRRPAPALLAGAGGEHGVLKVRLVQLPLDVTRPRRYVVGKASSDRSLQGALGVSGRVHSSAAPLSPLNSDAILFRVALLRLRSTRETRAEINSAGALAGASA